MRTHLGGSLWRVQGGRNCSSANVLIMFGLFGIVTTQTRWSTPVDGCEPFVLRKAEWWWNTLWVFMVAVEMCLL